MDRHNYFYISGLAGGMRGEVIPRALSSPRTIAPLLEQDRTVILVDWNLSDQVSEHPGVRLVRDGDKVDLYFTGDSVADPQRERGGEGR